MNEEPYIPERFFERFDEGLSDKERATLLYQCDMYYRQASERAGKNLPLPPADIEILLEYSRDESPKLRRIAMEVLRDCGFATWEDLEIWALDPDKDVRDAIIWNLDFVMVVEEWTDQDRRRHIALLEAVIARYADYTAGITLHTVAASGDTQYLEVTWETAERLLDSGDKDITTLLVCCYFEHVIPEQNWGPDDPHINFWITGNDFTRKCVLLDVAAWSRLTEGRTRDIVATLTKDPDKSIASAASEMLEQYSSKDGTKEKHKKRDRSDKR